MQEKYDLNTPVRYFKGVGPKRGECLSRLGIKTAGDALYYLPSRYEDRSSFTAIKDLRVGERHTVKAKVVTVSSRRAKSGIAIFQIAVTDGTGFVHAVFFNQPYLADYIRRNKEVVLYGKVERYDKLQIVQPEYEILKGDETDSVHVGRIVPVYPACAELTQRFLRVLMFDAVSKYAASLVERLPTYLRARQKLVDIRFAVNNIHFPANFENLERAYRRIVFEEFFMLQLALARRKARTQALETAHRHAVDGSLVEEFKRGLPFEFTDGQKKAIADIGRDMSSGRPMNRLLEGDVGSGKTVVAAYALTLTVQNGCQGVIMAPTEVLARQHFIVLSELLMPLGINVALLIGGMGRGARQEIYSAVKDGKVDVVVGTHAVIQERLDFRKLGLAVVDEQHKFGVAQRAVLKDKGASPHILVMTATPIPRTLALTIYGDLDISIIRELPKGRKPIATYWVEEAKRQEVYGFVREELDKGRQAYVVCPLIESQGKRRGDTGGERKTGDDRGGEGKAGSDSGGGVERRAAAEELFEKLKKEIFVDYEVGLLHGRMASKEKDRIMKDFKKGKIQVLVSTIVIEVGIDAPNATVMLVENAEQFGLAQLHQLRGRIGRGSHESFCILLADPKTEGAVERLKAVEATLDGFQIAEADLNIRGPGEFFGTMQHGLPEIRFGNILKDFDIMEIARKEAFSLTARDPGLGEEHHRALKSALASRFRVKHELIGVG
jgi:ATP-dependent DNA helicase RecG